MSETILLVFLQGEEIGTLALLAGDQSLFSFNEFYIADQNRKTLSLSFKSTTGRLITDVKPTRTRIPPFFSNLLPEGPMREYLAKKAGVKDVREFFLLKVLGQDLPGAVTVESPHQNPYLYQNETVYNRQDAIQNGGYHFSLAGVQLKFSAINEKSGRLTIPVQGTGGGWIVKLPSVSFRFVPENEYAMMSLAARVGILVPEIALVPLDQISGLPEDMGRFEGNAFAIKRFDRREDGTRIHMEDFAQVFGAYPEKKYEKASYRNIAEVIMSESGEEDLLEFIRRLIFNTLIGNADMHLKNWSLIFPDGRKPRLAPAYDFLSTIPYISDARTALNLVRSKEMAGLSIDELARFSAKAKLPESRIIHMARETVERFIQTWKNGEYLNSLPFVRDVINGHIKKIKLVDEVLSKTR